MSYEHEYPVRDSHEPPIVEHETDYYEDPARVRRRRLIMAGAIGAAVLVTGGLIVAASESINHATNGLGAHSSEIPAMTATETPGPSTTSAATETTASPTPTAPTTTTEAPTTTATPTASPTSQPEVQAVGPDFSDIGKGCGVATKLQPDGTQTPILVNGSEVMVGFTSPNCISPGQPGYNEHAPIALRPGQTITPTCRLLGGASLRADNENANVNIWVVWQSRDNGNYYTDPNNLLHVGALAPCSPQIRALMGNAPNADQ